MVLARASTAEIEKVAVLSGMQSLRMDAIAKARAGLSTLEEALTVVSLN